MIRAFHFVWTCYGWWFPNDPRGSWSQEVWVPTIRGLGEAHLGRRPVQPSPDALRAWLAQAQRHLRHEPAVLDGPAARAAAMGIRQTIERHTYCLHALSIMPDHAHAVVRRHEHDHERIVGDLKSGASKWARRQSGKDAHRSAPDPSERRRQRVPVWSRRYWVRFLDHDDAIRRAVRAVTQNPVRAGLRPQRWSFITPF